MASLASNLNSVASLCNGRESWRIKVRVVRMWEMCPISEPGKPFAVQMVLIDAEVWPDSVNVSICMNCIYVKAVFCLIFSV